MSKESKEHERQIYCYVCKMADKFTMAILWNGYGEGVCSEECAKVHNGEVLADWKQICTLSVDIRRLTRQIEMESK
jgi:hypothetical protein